MKLDGEGNDDDLIYYYREWNIYGKLLEFLDEHIGDNVEITIKVLPKKSGSNKNT